MTTTDNERRDTTTTTDRFAAKAHDAVDSVAERAQRAEREVRTASYIESNPLAFAGIAFAAGVLLSSLFRR